jgi:hypothetical protein
MEHIDHEGQDGLDGIEGMLREHRAESNPLELDQIKLRAMQQAGRSKRPKTVWMRSRLVGLLSCAVIGLGTPAALAWCGGGGGGSQGGSGGYGQYGPPPCQNSWSWDGHHCQPDHNHGHWFWGWGWGWFWHGNNYSYGQGYCWRYGY